MFGWDFDAQVWLRFWSWILINLWYDLTKILWWENSTPGSVVSLAMFIIIGPESDHWECLSVTDWLTHWLTHCRLVNLIDVTLACEDGNSKLVEVVTVVEVDDEKRVDNSLVQIWKVNFGHKVKFLFGLWGQGFKVCSRFWSWCSGKILKLKFGHYFAADAWLWLWSSFLVEILVWFGQDF